MKQTLLPRRLDLDWSESSDDGDETFAECSGNGFMECSHQWLLEDEENDEKVDVKLTTVTDLDTDCKV